jgi:hypothetical protein
MGAWPTNDGLTMTYVEWLVEEFRAFRADVEGNLLGTLDWPATSASGSGPAAAPSACGNPSP